ncbi:MAG: signal peptidase I [Candidatus Bathyarchaeia archaeon]
MKLRHKHRKLIIDVLIIVIVVLSVFFTYLGLQFFLATNKPLVIVASGSMSPALEVGDIVIVQGVPATEIKVGDIIVFEEPNRNELTVHRVIEIETKEDGTIFFTTKGDANPIQDTSSVDSSLVHGRVINRIPYLGYIAINPIIPIILVIIIVIILFLWPEKTKRFRRKHRGT